MVLHAVVWSVWSRVGRFSFSAKFRQFSGTESDHAMPVYQVETYEWLEAELYCIIIMEQATD